MSKWSAALVLSTLVHFLAVYLSATPSLPLALAYSLLITSFVLRSHGFLMFSTKKYLSTAVRFAFAMAAQLFRVVLAILVAEPSLIRFRCRTSVSLDRHCLQKMSCPVDIAIWDQARAVQANLFPNSSELVSTALIPLIEEVQLMAREMQYVGLAQRDMP